MKKIIVGLFFIVITYVAFLLIIPLMVYLYLHYFPVTREYQNILSSTSNLVQIGYNSLYIIIAVVIIILAYDQLGKTREATTIQTLINIDNFIRSDTFLEKRKTLADLILTNGVANLSSWLKEKKKKKKLTEEETKELAFIKNIIEDVIYQFELVGHFYRKNIFTIDDVYELFSIEIQHYWVLIHEIGYIEYLRENKIYSSKDFYNEFESLFNAVLKQEIIQEYNNSIVKFALKCYYRSNIYKLFYHKHYYLSTKRKHNKIFLLIEKNRKMIDLFLIEEKNLIK